MKIFKRKAFIVKNYTGKYNVIADFGDGYQMFDQSLKYLSDAVFSMQDSRLKPTQSPDVIEDWMLATLTPQDIAELFPKRPGVKAKNFEGNPFVVNQLTRMHLNYYLKLTKKFAVK